VGGFWTSDVRTPIERLCAAQTLKLRCLPAISHEIAATANLRMFVLMDQSLSVVFPVLPS
jgi:hypothetical protein